MPIRIEGFDRLTRQLRDLEGRARALDGTHEVPFVELFPPAFIARYTDFADIQAMLDESPFEIETSEDFRRIPDEDWDGYVPKRTRFSTWRDMQEKAVGEWTKERLGL